MNINLKTYLGSLKLSNPILVASGAFGYGDEFKDILDINKLGGIITKTITYNPRKGNKPPRLAETSSGLLNSIGLQNVGLHAFIDEKLPKLSFIKVPLIVSIAGETIDEFGKIARALNGINEVHAVELNLSCPNIKNAGKVFAEDSMTVARTVLLVRKVFRRPVLVKLSPMIYDIIECVQSARTAGADGVTIANTFPGMAIDIEKKMSKIGTSTGGLSGPAIKPLALRLVWMVAKETGMSILASGGASSLEDVMEFLIAGARAVSLGTVLYADPKAPEKIIDGLQRYMENNKIAGLSSVIGSFK